MEFFPLELLRKIATNYDLSFNDRLNLRLVHSRWRLVINDSLKIWQQRQVPYNSLDANLWTKPQSNKNPKEIRTQIIKTEKKLDKIQREFYNYRETHDIFQPTNYRGLGSRIGFIRLEGTALMIYYWNGFVQLYNYDDSFFQPETPPIAEFNTGIRFPETVHYTSHTIIVEWTIKYKRDFALFNIQGEKYLERKDGYNEVKNLKALDKHLFVCKLYDEQNKHVLFRYNNVGGRFEKTGEKLVRQNFIDFDVTETHLVTLQSSFTGFGGSLVLELFNLADTLLVQSERRRIFEPRSLGHPLDYRIFKTNKLREFRRAFGPPNRQGPRRQLDDFWVGLKTQSLAIFKTRYVGNPHTINHTWVGSVDVLLNENREELVYRFDMQWFSKEGLYDSLSFVELEGGFGFLYASNRHIFLKRFDNFVN